MTIRKRLDSITCIIDGTPLLKESTEIVEGFIEREGIITGSSAWGVETKDSDIDVMFEPDCALTYDLVMRNHNGLYINAYNEDSVHYRGVGLKSCYVLLEGNIYNLLFFSSEGHYQAWFGATQQMKILSQLEWFKKKIKDKETRIEIFEDLKSTYIGEYN
jgi:hypothetical protein